MKGWIWMRNNRIWLVPALLAAVIKTVSFFPGFVEMYYTRGLYVLLSKIQRFLLGWIPFSIGDLLYALLLLYIIIKAVQGAAWLFRKHRAPLQWKKKLRRILLTVLYLYVIFYGLWGLNYSRQGIATQFALPAVKPAVQDLDILVQLLHSRINKDILAVRTRDRDSLKSRSYLFKQAAEAYRMARNEYPFLDSRPASVKSSLFGTWMNYTGVQGYYNPFSGEAQVNTTIPVFLLPSVVTHEIAHQAGYGMESEANFISFLTSRKHPSVHFQYATDFVMYAYAVNLLFWEDSVRAKHYNSTLHPQVLQDIADYRAFYKKYESRVEALTDWIYGSYLKANNQPSGQRSYDEVVFWLIGWYKKHGKDAI
ncbi:DUF3810 domain-containing protein [Niabella beijingensis]|uniref:DUF3810 domain-containing protein n=1 Tax=Niabella beijingensis TaxID=2872700 RepID=UPI001CBBC9CC|nr:DUF3810 domain-containing protein [Niabella beijingensis]MBZ4190705.1 DUF3810 domain-containing protein [Niabella beijingensis]